MEAHDTNERHSVQPPGRIEVLPGNSRFRDRYSFVAKDADDEIVVKGDEFRSSMFWVGYGKTERAKLDALIQELAVLGWHAVPAGEMWYQHHIYYVGQEKVPVPASASARADLSRFGRRRWFLAIVLILFNLLLLCLLVASGARW